MYKSDKNFCSNNEWNDYDCYFFDRCQLDCSSVCINYVGNRIDNYKFSKWSARGE